MWDFHICRYANVVWLLPCHDAVFVVRTKVCFPQRTCHTRSSCLGDCQAPYRMSHSHTAVSMCPALVAAYSCPTQHTSVLLWWLHAVCSTQHTHVLCSESLILAYSLFSPTPLAGLASTGGLPAERAMLGDTGLSLWGNQPSCANQWAHQLPLPLQLATRAG
jgi:hypothetical protein